MSSGLLCSDILFGTYKVLIVNDESTVQRIETNIKMLLDAFYCIEAAKTIQQLVEFLKVLSRLIPVSKNPIIIFFSLRMCISRFTKSLKKFENERRFSPTRIAPSLSTSTQILCPNSWNLLSIQLNSSLSPKKVGYYFKKTLTFGNKLLKR